MIDPELKLFIRDEIKEMTFSEKQVESIERAVVNVLSRELKPMVATQERHSTILYLLGAAVVVMVPVVVSIYQGKG